MRGRVVDLGARPPSIYMVIRPLYNPFTWLLPCLHGARIVFVVIYVVFQGVVPIYMGEGIDCHVDLFAPHVEHMFTWVYMLRGPSPCK